MAWCIVYHIICDGLADGTKTPGCLGSADEAMSREEALEDAKAEGWHLSQRLHVCPPCWEVRRGKSSKVKESS